MIWNEIKKDLSLLKTDVKSLRKFGLTLGIVFSLIAGYQFWRRHGFWVYFGGVGGFFLIFGILFPKMLKWVQAAWMLLAFMMGWVMTRVILFMLFFFVVTPISLIGRACGTRFLDRRWKTGSSTEWIERPEAAIDPSAIEKQF